MSHVPRHVLELAAAEGSERIAERAALKHLTDCGQCRVRLQAIQDANRRYLDQFPPSAFIRAVSSRNRARRSWWPVGFGAAVAMAAGIAIWMRPPDEVVRLKGGVLFNVHVRRGDRTWHVNEGEKLIPGDRLAFSYATGGKSRYVTVVGVDGRQTQIYYRSSAPIVAAQPAQLSVGVVLDSQLGEERIYALFSTKPLDEAAIREAALAGPSARRLSVDAEQVSVGFRK